MKVKFKELPREDSTKILDMPLKTVLATIASRVKDFKLPGGSLRVKTDEFTFDINVYKNETLNSERGN